MASHVVFHRIRIRLVDRMSWRSFALQLDANAADRNQLCDYDCETPIVRYSSISQWSHFYAVFFLPCCRGNNFSLRKGCCKVFRAICIAKDKLQHFVLIAEHLPGIDERQMLDRDIDYWSILYFKYVSYVLRLFSWKYKYMTIKIWMYKFILICDYETARFGRILRFS